MMMRVSRRSKSSSSSSRRQTRAADNEELTAAAAATKFELHYLAPIDYRAHAQVLRNGSRVLNNSSATMISILRKIAKKEQQESGGSSDYLVHRESDVRAALRYCSNGGGGGRENMLPAAAGILSELRVVASSASAASSAARASSDSSSSYNNDRLVASKYDAELLRLQKERTIGSSISSSSVVAAAAEEWGGGVFLERQALEASFRRSLRMHDPTASDRYAQYLIRERKLRVSNNGAGQSLAASFVVSGVSLVATAAVVSVAVPYLAASAIAVPVGMKLYIPIYTGIWHVVDGAERGWRSSSGKERWKHISSGLLKGAATGVIHVFAIGWMSKSVSWGVREAIWGAVNSDAAPAIFSSLVDHSNYAAVSEFLEGTGVAIVEGLMDTRTGAIGNNFIIRGLTWGEGQQQYLPTPPPPPQHQQQQRMSSSILSASKIKSTAEAASWSVASHLFHVFCGNTMDSYMELVKQNEGGGTSTSLLLPLALGALWGGIKATINKALAWNTYEMLVASHLWQVVLLPMIIGWAITVSFYLVSYAVAAAAKLKSSSSGGGKQRRRRRSRQQQAAAASSAFVMFERTTKASMQAVLHILLARLIERRTGISAATFSDEDEYNNYKALLISKFDDSISSSIIRGGGGSGDDGDAAAAAAGGPLPRSQQQQRPFMAAAMMDEEDFYRASSLPTDTVKAHEMLYAAAADDSSSSKKGGSAAAGSSFVPRYVVSEEMRGVEGVSDHGVRVLVAREVDAAGTIIEGGYSAILSSENPLFDGLYVRQQQQRGLPFSAATEAAAAAPLSYVRADIDKSVKEQLLLRRGGTAAAAALYGFSKKEQDADEMMLRLGVSGALENQQQRYRERLANMPKWMQDAIKNRNYKHVMSALELSTLYEQESLAMAKERDTLLLLANEMEVLESQHSEISAAQKQLAEDVAKFEENSERAAESGTWTKRGFKRSLLQGVFKSNPMILDEEIAEAEAILYGGSGDNTAAASTTTIAHVREPNIDALLRKIDQTLQSGKDYTEQRMADISAILDMSLPSGGSSSSISDHYDALIKSRAAEHADLRRNGLPSNYRDATQKLQQNIAQLGRNAEVHKGLLRDIEQWYRSDWVGRRFYGSSSSNSSRRVPAAAAGVVYPSVINSSVMRKLTELNRKLAYEYLPAGLITRQQLGALNNRISALIGLLRRQQQQQQQSSAAAAAEQQLQGIGEDIQQYIRGSMDKRAIEQRRESFEEHAAYVRTEAAILSSEARSVLDLVSWLENTSLLSSDAAAAADDGAAATAAMAESIANVRGMAEKALHSADMALQDVLLFPIHNVELGKMRSIAELERAREQLHSAQGAIKMAETDLPEFREQMEVLLNARAANLEQELIRKRRYIFYVYNDVASGRVTQSLLPQEMRDNYKDIGAAELFKIDQLLRELRSSSSGGWRGGGGPSSSSSPLLVDLRAKMESFERFQNDAREQLGAMVGEAQQVFAKEIPAALHRPGSVTHEEASISGGGGSSRIKRLFALFSTSSTDSSNGGGAMADAQKKTTSKDLDAISDMLRAFLVADRIAPTKDASFKQAVWGDLYNKVKTAAAGVAEAEEGIYKDVTRDIERLILSSDNVRSLGVDTHEAFLVVAQAMQRSELPQQQQTSFAWTDEQEAYILGVIGAVDKLNEIISGSNSGNNPVGEEFRQLVTDMESYVLEITSEDYGEDVLVNRVRTADTIYKYLGRVEDILRFWAVPSYSTDAVAELLGNVRELKDNGAEFHYYNRHYEQKRIGTGTGGVNFEFRIDVADVLSQIGDLELRLMSLIPQKKEGGSSWVVVSSGGGGNEYVYQTITFAQSALSETTNIVGDIAEDLLRSSSSSSSSSSGGISNTRSIPPGEVEGLARARRAANNKYIFGRSGSSELNALLDEYHNMKRFYVERGSAGLQQSRALDDLIDVLAGQQREEWEAAAEEGEVELRMDLMDDVQRALQRILQKQQQQQKLELAATVDVGGPKFLETATRDILQRYAHDVGLYQQIRDAVKAELKMSAPELYKCVHDIEYMDIVTDNYTTRVVDRRSGEVLEDVSDTCVMQSMLPYMVQRGGVAAYLTADTYLGGGITGTLLTSTAASAIYTNLLFNTGLPPTNDGSSSSSSEKNSEVVYHFYEMLKSAGASSFSTPTDYLTRFISGPSAAQKLGRESSSDIFLGELIIENMFRMALDAQPASVVDFVSDNIGYTTEFAGNLLEFATFARDLYVLKEGGGDSPAGAGAADPPDALQEQAITALVKELIEMGSGAHMELFSPLASELLKSGPDNWHALLKHDYYGLRKLAAVELYAAKVFGVDFGVFVSNVAMRTGHAAITSNTGKNLIKDALFGTSSASSTRAHMDRMMAASAAAAEEEEETSSSSLFMDILRGFDARGILTTGINLSSKIDGGGGNGVISSAIIEGASNVASYIGSYLSKSAVIAFRKGPARR